MLTTFSSPGGQWENVLEGLDWRKMFEVIVTHAGTEREAEGLEKIGRDAKDKEVEVEKSEVELLGAERRADRSGLIRCNKKLRAGNVRRMATEFISLVLRPRSPLLKLNHGI